MSERIEKLQFYAQMAKEAAEQITSGLEPWTGFLTTAARLYKYSFADQLMIYRQRPDATACAEYGLWNNTMGRYIKKGSKGIALLDNRGDVPQLRYVFDVSDTGTRRSSRPVPQWDMQEEYHAPVMTALERTFGISGIDGLLMQLTEIANVLASDYWDSNSSELGNILAGSGLSRYDNATIEETFRETAASSIRYALYTRCTDNPNAFFSYTDFRDILGFNTQAAVSALGTAVSSLSGQVFREIEAAIRTYERERSQYHDRTDLHTAGRLPDSQPSNEPEPAGTPGPVREHAESVSSGAPGADLQPPVPDRAAVPASSGSPAHRNPADGASDDRAAQEESAPEQGDGSAGMGSAHEQPESPGGGDHSGRADLQLNFDGSEQLSFLNLIGIPPSETEQIRRIDEAERAMPSAFSVPQAVINQFLRFGSNTADSRMNIVSEFSKGKPISVLVPFLRTQYHGGYGIEAGGVQYSAWYADEGIRISAGKAARYANSHVLISWETAAQRIEELLLEGTFATNLEVVEAPTHERAQLASSLWNVQRDRSALARENGYLSELAALVDGVYPEAVHKIAAALGDPVRRDALIAEYQVFYAALAQEPQLLTFRNRDTAWLAAALPELPMPRKDYPATLPELPAVSSFITTDEINAAIASHGSGMAGGRHRIYAYFETHALRADRAAFLKQEYGIGGHAPALSGAQHSSEDHDSKGICFKKAGCENVLLSWPSLAKRIGELMEDRRYLTEEELARLDDWEYDVEQDLTEDSEETNAVAEAESTAETSWEPQLGQAVYLDDTRYVIESVGLFDVHLTDNTQTYPITRVESKERLPSLARLDDRNDPLFAAPAQESVPFSVEPDVTVEQSEIPESAALPAENFHITDDHLGEGGPKTKFRRNLDAIRLLKELEQDNRQASAEEQEILSQYVGWGGLAYAFDESKTDWASEFQELSAALTPEEYADARASTLNAHYTSPTVIRAIYDAVERLGFHTGNILEPSIGVGNFFGMLPDSMAGSNLYGVELDSISGRIAKQLYPNAEITVAGFETTDRRDFFDLAVGNVPFGNYKVNDRPYNKLGFSIHNYFFAKAVDQVRPGGIIAFVTSRYTMDSANTEARKYIAQRAELLGTIRLPNNAFRANAGTDVVSDILFLQKREQPIDLESDWVHLGMTEDGLPLNSYYLDHPEMVLGTLTSESTQYGKDSLTVLPLEGADLSVQLSEAISHVHGSYQTVQLDSMDLEPETKVIPADPNVKNFSYAVVDGEIYFRENSVMTPVTLNQTAKERMKGMVALRQTLEELIAYQLEDYPGDAISAKQQELNTAYDAFSAKYGLINDRANAKLFDQDSSYYLLCSLENLDENGALKSKADIFTKRTIRPTKAITSADAPSEALAISIGERGKVDLPYMAELLGAPGEYEPIIQALHGVIFKDPMAPDDLDQGWQTADEYLSGNVRDKLRVARLAAEKDAAFAVNVEALEKAQPKDLDASEIDVRLGATWIDPKYIQQFMVETFDTPFYLRRYIQVQYAKVTAEWRISGKSDISYNDVAAYTTFGTSRANAYKILEDTLNLKDVRIYDAVEDADSKQKRVLNKKETTLAQQKQQAIKDAFSTWVWKEPQRREALVTQYNELFNSLRPRHYDGSHIVFGGMNPEITLREHQRGAIAHVLYGGNTLLAHEVGAGKTFEMAASAMESKRLGLCQKSLFVVPNHLTGQWASEFLTLYPSAKLLVATKKDFETARRKKFCSRIATGDYDAVIIGHSQFEKIPISPERQERLLQEQIDELTEAIDSMKYRSGERFTVKQMEKTRKSLQARLEKLTDPQRKDDVVYFEQLGIDRLFVDEAQGYKNLFLYTKMRNVAGLSTSEAQKSSDMFMKCRYMDELTGGRGVIFATGTPVSNSMTELYTMQRYLQYGTLQRMGLGHFDCWASTFGETTTAIELVPEGTGYRARTRFAKFFNLPELMSLFQEVADIKTADQLNLPRPEAKYETVVVEPSEIQQEMVQSLSQRAVDVHAGTVDSSVDNMLCITNDGRKIGLDQRLMNPMLPDDPNSKLNACVRKVLDIYETGQADKLTQLIFCDLSTPKNDGNFNVYEDIKGKLLASGVPESEVAFIHDADTDAKKTALFSKVRSGDVRILMGSTQKMGAGTNVQDRLIAVHHLDVGWKPADLTQRNGRIIRQGNRNPEVQIYNYVTNGTFDAYLFQTLENKQKFISQIMTSKSPVRACEDVDEQALSFAEIKALCAGNPAIKEKMDLDIEVARLKVLRADHLSQQYRLEDQLLKYFPAEIEKYQNLVSSLTVDMQTVQNNPTPAEGFVGIELQGKSFAEKELAGEALLAACKSYTGAENVQIGSYRGFRIELDYDHFQNAFLAVLHGQLRHAVTLGADARGNLTRLDNALSKIPSRIEAANTQLENLYNQQAAAKEELGKPFPQEQELQQKSARLAELDAELSMDGPSEPETPAPEERPSVLRELRERMAQLADSRSGDDMEVAL